MPKGFASDTSEKTGVSKRTIQLATSRAKAIPADIRDTIKGTKLDTGVYIIAQRLMKAARLDAANKAKRASTRVLDVEDALKVSRQMWAIGDGVAKEHKDDARRAARVCETAVGEALGPATDKGGRGNKASATTDGFSRDESWRFHLMATHRDLWWPVLAEKALSRRQVLTMIAEANHHRTVTV